MGLAIRSRFNEGRSCCGLAFEMERRILGADIWSWRAFRSMGLDGALGTIHSSSNVNDVGGSSSGIRERCLQPNRCLLRVLGVQIHRVEDSPIEVNLITP